MHERDFSTAVEDTYFYRPDTYLYTDIDWGGGGGGVSATAMCQCYYTAKSRNSIIFKFLVLIQQ